MKSGSAPHTTMSSTTMPTRSKPIVSWMSRACAMATLVPTPSVLVARTGRVILAMALASNMPAKPPRPPSTSGRVARRTEAFISSTALSPASTSTPAEAYVMGASLTATSLPSRSKEHSVRPERGRIALSIAPSGVLQGVLPADPDAERDALDVDGAVVPGADRQRQRLEDVLADAAVLRQLDRVPPGEARRAQLGGRLVRRADHPLLGDVAERVGADRGADLL